MIDARKLAGLHVVRERLRDACVFSHSLTGWRIVERFHPRLSNSGWRRTCSWASRFCLAAWIRRILFWHTTSAPSGVRMRAARRVAGHSTDASNPGRSLRAAPSAQSRTAKTVQAPLWLPWGWRRCVQMDEMGAPRRPGQRLSSWSLGEAVGMTSLGSTYFSEVVLVGNGAEFLLVQLHPLASWLSIPAFSLPDRPASLVLLAVSNLAFCSKLGIPLTWRCPNIISLSLCACSFLGLCRSLIPLPHHPIQRLSRVTDRSLRHRTNSNLDTRLRLNLKPHQPDPRPAAVASSVLRTKQAN